MERHDIEVFDEKLRIAGWVGLAGISVFAPVVLLELAGLGGIFAAIAGFTLPLRVLSWLALWGVSFVLVAGLVRGTLIFLAFAAQKAWQATERLTAVSSTLLIEGALILGALCAWPFRRLYERGLERIGERLALWKERRRQEAELRRLYREEFRGQFASFREFKAQFDGEDGARASSGQEQEQQEERAAEQPASDPFRAACALLGLPETSAFTAGALKERFRTLMKAVHPDVIGESGFARQLNDAYATIKQRKGWK